MGVSFFSPAKINLYLAVTGRRGDGYHELVSLAAPLDFGDTLEARGREARDGKRFGLECDDPAVPLDETNLVLRAAHAFVAATGWGGRVDFKLTKRIPLGAGLGGGSSNAVAALRAMNQLAGDPLSAGALAGLAADLGSDCALFLAGEPAVLRGRGESVTPLAAPAAARLRGRRVLVFKPAFAISTPWAYGRMAAAPHLYEPAGAAEEKLARWQHGGAPTAELLYNNLETVAFEKFLALPVLREKLRRECGVEPRMSGSGSACFILWEEPGAPAPEMIPCLTRCIRDCWGERAFVCEAVLL